jgi:putative SOS response-associated peptidase YedK
VLRLGARGEPLLQSMHWGLVPSFQQAGEKVDAWRMFNARSETAGTNAVFRRLLGRWR